MCTASTWARPPICVSAINARPPVAQAAWQALLFVIRHNIRHQHFQRDFLRFISRTFERLAKNFPAGLTLIADRGHFLVGHVTTDLLIRMAVSCLESHTCIGCHPIPSDPSATAKIQRSLLHHQPRRKRLETRKLSSMQDRGPTDRTDLDLLPSIP